MSWDYTDVYVAACGRPCRTWREGRDHESWCVECQRVIRGEEEEPDLEEEDDE